MNSVCFVGNYPPRCCGIATFTQDLREGVRRASRATQTSVVAVSDAADGYAYPAEVRWVIAEQNNRDYARVAEAINRSGVEVVCLQHEFGIYGGPSGGLIVDFLRRLQPPVVTTCHTVLKSPSAIERHVLKEIARFSSHLVVMARKGRDLLTANFGVSPEIIKVIPHGIPESTLSPGNREALRTARGWTDRQVLLTFGLLSPNKGLEYSIRALPDIARHHPDVLYVITGATHPNLVRCQGEAYRDKLEKLVAEVGMQDHVQFINRFVSRPELVGHITAADVYLTPYLNEAQVTSGTLAFAFGLGKPVISTPYWHAAELLAGGAGELVPFADTPAITGAAVRLLGDPHRMARLSANAREVGKEMSWGAVASRYLELFETVAAPARHAVVSQRERPAPAVSLPARFMHLERMTGAHGIYQHARLDRPDPHHGFCTDDNARAAIFLLARGPVASGRGINLLDSPTLSLLAERSLVHLVSAFNPRNSRFRNFMDVRGNWLEERGSEDSHGRALWAIGSVLAAGPTSGGAHLRLADLFVNACDPVPEFTSPRTWAFALLGLAGYREAFPDHGMARNLQNSLADRLVRLYERQASAHWRWFEDVLTYDNGKLPEALLATYRQTRRRELLNIGLTTLGFLVEAQTTTAGFFRPPGCNGFWRRDGKRAVFDQQPLEAQAMVAACLEAHRATDDKGWLQAAAMAYDWFHGANDLGLPVAEVDSGACHDALVPGGCNRNQGAESTLAYLQASADLLREGVRTPLPVTAGATGHPVDRDGRPGLIVAA